MVIVATLQTNGVCYDQTGIILGNQRVTQEDNQFWNNSYSHTPAVT